MARIRTIKPEFFTSADIVSLSPLARLLYIALWCEADKEGRLVWRPATFKLRYLPGDDCDVNALCDEIVKAGLVVPYGDGLAHIPTFAAHQHINPRESASQLPAPDASARVGTRRARVGTRAYQELTDREEGKGREDKEKPPKPPAQPSASLHRFPPGFETLWAEYPRKVGKDAAARAFAKRRPDEALLRAMVGAVKAQRGSPQWAKDAGQFIPHLATWLNEGRWQDEGCHLTAGDDVFAGAV